ncbi:Gfo/Idh/MocA family protein [Zunongwangia endophytica]|uniref:Gfo/Idh/MocA family protein n=1 Tax=Zunongwangia endophytica TaxID=1808945 RepID=A0ABV8H1G4_9FLAO|nr:Gfo/Idh/MocA family oxidoreductase [Zunongwangia endophytica]MDN3594547.1 Gfo/Idh/MocA family oxidoreductase [Zunongwangia endophytica]
MTKIINWAILGPGKIAKKFALGLEHVPNANLYAAASRSLDKAKDFAEEMGADNAYGSYTEMLNDPEVDAVYVATPHVFHHEHTLLCLKHKKAVLCEKPFAMNKEQVKEMINFAQKQDTFLMEAMWTNFLPHFKYTSEIIKSGKYGKVLSMEADFGFNAPFDPESRIYNKSLGGGSLLDIGIYPIFAALSFLGKPKKIEATAEMTKTEVDARCHATFTYPENVKAELYSFVDKETDVAATIKLEKAEIYITPRFHNPSSVVITTPTDSFTKEFGVTANGYNFEAEHVGEMLRENRKESTDMTFAKSLELIETLDQVREKIGLEY